MSLQTDLSAGDGNIGQTLLPAQVLHEPEKAGMVLMPLEHIHWIGGRGGHVFLVWKVGCARWRFSRAAWSNVDWAVRVRANTLHDEGGNRGFEEPEDCNVGLKQALAVSWPGSSSSSGFCKQQPLSRASRDPERDTLQQQWRAKRGAWKRASNNMLVFHYSLQLHYLILHMRVVLYKAEATTLQKPRRHYHHHHLLCSYSRCRLYIRRSSL